MRWDAPVWLGFLLALLVSLIVASACWDYWSSRSRAIPGTGTKGWAAGTAARAGAA